jgi:hypothetical protein
MPSCMRAPPEAANSTKGVRLSTAVSSPLITASPAAMPSEPPMKSKSCTPTVSGVALDHAVADLDGVLRMPVLARASFRRST